VRLGLRPQNEQFHDKLVRWVSRWSDSPLNVSPLIIMILAIDYNIVDWNTEDVS
jgi:hypothetical protein